MKLEMQDERQHQVEIRGQGHVVTTGRVENGWMWLCAGAMNPDGPKASREMALDAAMRELTARSCPLED